MARLTVIGLGPGDAALLAPMARQALADARVVAGYGTYLDLVEPELLAGKDIVESGMMREMERVQAALDAARSGKDTVLVSSGDAGVYGMAGSTKWTSPWCRAYRPCARPPRSWARRSCTTSRP